LKSPIQIGKAWFDRIFAGFRRDGGSDAAGPCFGTGGILTMKADFRGRAAPVLAGTALALIVAGCSATTYGTGTSAGLQTVTDLVKAGSLGEKKDPIDFNPRPPVVAPPSTATLPVPGSGGTGPTVAANWPKDPDQQVTIVKSQIADAQANGRPITVKPTAGSVSSEATGSINTDDPNNYKTTSAQQAEVKRLLALANSGGSDGRQYLTDPPAGYLAPDPTAPAPSPDAVKKANKGLKWPWQWFSKN
jgi:hypothetical protein